MILCIDFQNVMNLKERKEMEDQFKKAQKPWAKILTKVNKTKLDYHNACKNEKTALHQERNASSDSSLSPDQVNTFLFPLFLNFFRYSCISELNLALNVLKKVVEAISYALH